MLTAIYPMGLPIALSLVGYNSFLTGLIVWLKRRDRAGFQYFIASFFIFLWGMGVSFMLHNQLPPATARTWGVFSQAAALFVPVTWTHFVLVYTNQEKQHRRTLWLTYFLTFAIFPFTFTRYFVRDFRPAVGVNQYPIGGAAYVAFTILFVITVVYSFFVFFAAIYQASSPQQKKDYKLVCFATLYGFITGSLSFLPVYGVPLPQYNLLLMPFWQFLLAYAMIRHQAFDLEKLAQAARKDKLAAIGTLATSINHEIRNPLYVIHGLAESHLINFEEGIYVTPEQALHKSNEILKKTAEQASRAMEIMRNFAMFAKKEISQEAQTESVHLNETLEGILPLISHEMELDKIEFVRNIPESLSPLKADRRHLEEILFNLIVNACQAMKIQEHRGKIEIAAAQHNGTVHIKVEDNGPGISPKQLSQIFEPFYTTKSEGTGLGLYVTKQLIEKNGGRISVKSKLGRGTEFHLEFKR